MRGGDRAAHLLKMCHYHSHQVLFVLQQWVKHFRDLNFGRVFLFTLLAQIASVRFSIRLWNCFFLCVFVGACGLVIADVDIAIVGERFFAIVGLITMGQIIATDIMLVIAAILSVLGMKVNDIRSHHILIELSYARDHVWQDLFRLFLTLGCSSSSAIDP